MNSLRFNPFPHLSSERLILRPLQVSDAAFIYKLRTTPENNTYLDLPYPKDLDDSLAQVRRIIKGIEEDKHIYWVIDLLDGTTVGTICLWHFDFDRNTAEIGYELIHIAQKNGYMTEAMTLVMDFAAASGLQHIEAYTHSENRSSIRLLERHGFAKTGTQQETHTITAEKYLHVIYTKNIQALNK